MPSQNLDQRTLFDVVLREGTAAFRAAVARYPDERFYAFCFYADCDVTSVYPTAATVEELARSCPSSELQERKYYQWAPAEWGLDFGQFDKHDLMSETNRLLRPDYANEGDESPEVFGARKLLTLKTLSEALLKIREIGVFSGHAARDPIACWVNIGDAGDEEIRWMFEPVTSHLAPDDLRDLREVYEMT
ncbi:MAG: DUF4303 domain-containing protein [Phycisphaera sp.]|nr:DUF4303 domain-containing protein [Phycisphaera sp.]